MERDDEEKSGRALFQLGLGVRDGRKHEGVGSLMEEKDFRPKTRETELRLALPGGDWHEGRRQTHLLEHYPRDNHRTSTTNSVGVKRMFSDTVDGFSTKEGSIHNLVSWSFSTPPSLTALPSNHTPLLQVEQNIGVPSMLKGPPPVVAPELNNTDMAALEQRVVVGWPPLRSFRKNFASSSSKPSGEIESSGASANESNTESCKIGLFVKINMDGVPIGRKIDLGAYDSYKKLSLAVDELFRALLAAQRANMSSAKGGSREEKSFAGLLDGSGEYTLVYEDDEGDRMLAGDIPWGMFVKSVKRLRVLKSSDLPRLLRG